MPNCSCLTAKLKPCKNRVSNSSEPYNGSYMCFRHIKQTQQREENGNINNENNSENYSNTSKRCCAKTKKGSRCTKKTKNESGMCFSHKKYEKNTQQRQCDENIENVVFSPNIKYRINNEHDNCYICLEETHEKLSCGHFIHSNCLLHSMQNLNLNRNNEQRHKIFEHKNKYFIVTNCLYCKQFSIIKNIKICEKDTHCQYINRYLNETSLTLKNIFKGQSQLKGHGFSKNNITFDDNSIAMCFNLLFQDYDTYENTRYINIENDKDMDNFVRDVKQLVFDNFSNIVFDNYIQQKSISKLPKKYGKINKHKIMEQIDNYIDDTLYSKKLYKSVKIKLYNFLEILEDIFYKINSKVNVQDEYLNLMNVF